MASKCPEPMTILRLPIPSLGSGVVISKDGYIITNNHVVEGADAIKATVNGVEYDAKVVGSDSSSDIAVIKVEADDLTPVEIGSSSDLQVGEWVMALGARSVWKTRCRPAW